MPPDWKVAKRIRDTGLMRDMHVEGVRCVLCGHWGSLHHVLHRGQGGDDVRSNLIGLCGDGVTGCHGLIEAEDEATRLALGVFIREHRPDTLFYLQGKLGEEAAREWMRRRLLVTLTPN